MRVLIKGAGDLATGIACRLFCAGFDIVMTETQTPTTVRKTVAFSQAVYHKKMTVEGIEAVLADSPREMEEVLRQHKIAVLVDPQLRFRQAYHADVLVDAILAKKNLGTKKTDAALVIGIGPGFTAGEDCHAVVESMRGHFLGRVLWQGSAIPNTATPGDIGGYSIERLIRASAAGAFCPVVRIGDRVKKGQTVAWCGEVPVHAGMDGMVRGMLEAGLPVQEGMKCGDIDPRCDRQLLHTVSDKARAVGGGVLEAIVSELL